MIELEARDYLEQLVGYSLFCTVITVMSSVEQTHTQQLSPLVLCNQAYSRHEGQCSSQFLRPSSIGTRNVRTLWPQMHIHKPLH
jgi:hypothetical protein